MSRMLYVGQQIADDLKDNISENLLRYKEGDFHDLESAGDWRIPLSFDADLDELTRLVVEGGSENEILNSIAVGRALGKLTPTLARENRIWIRLSHVECLDYSRKRWLRVDMDDEDRAKAVSKHFFASTLTGCRDDHSISRLWWNYHIAKQIMPGDPALALKMILSRADIRLNFLERPGLAARPVLARGIVRALEKNADLLKGEKLFRDFIKYVNLQGAGLLFEVWSERRIDQFTQNCLDATRKA